MTFKAFVRQNVVLVVGLTLPILVMAAFLAASALPQTLADPPKYSLVFASSDYSPSVRSFPVGARLVVRDGVLHAQFTQLAGRGDTEWKRLYLYDASTGKVRQLAFELPADAGSIQVMRDDVVESTRSYTLDTTLQAPDGYELTFGDHMDGAFFNELLWRSRDGYGPRLTRKGGGSVRLTATDGQPAFGYGSVEFLGWVTATRGGQ